MNFKDIILAVGFFTIQQLLFKIINIKMTNIQFISKVVATAAINIQNTVQLLQEDCTIPFISRYRKDTTGNLDEVQIEQIAKLQKEYEVIVKRKETILKSIEEQNSLRKK